MEEKSGSLSIGASRGVGASAGEMLMHERQGGPQADASAPLPLTHRDASGQVTRPFCASVFPGMKRE